MGISVCVCTSGRQVLLAEVDAATSKQANTDVTDKGRTEDCSIINSTNKDTLDVLDIRHSQQHNDDR